MATYDNLFAVGAHGGAGFTGIGPREVEARRARLAYHRFVLVLPAGGSGGSRRPITGEKPRDTGKHEGPTEHHFHYPTMKTGSRGVFGRTQGVFSAEPIARRYVPGSDPPLAWQSSSPAVNRWISAYSSCRLERRPKYSCFFPSRTGTSHRVSRLLKEGATDGRRGLVR